MRGWCLLAVAVVLLSGCSGGTAPSPSPSKHTPKPSSSPPVAPEEGTDACGLHRVVADPYATPAATMQGDLDSQAARLAAAFNDTLSPGQTPHPSPAPGKSLDAFWTTATGGHVKVTSFSVSDDTVSGSSWPATEWEYFSSKRWPASPDRPTDNATVTATLARLTGTPAAWVSTTDLPEPAEHETEYYVNFRLGDLPKMQFGNGKIGDAGVNFTRVLLRLTYDLPADFAPLPTAQLQATAQAYAACWLSAHNATTGTLAPGSSATHILNGTLVVAFGFTDPSAKGKSGCFDNRILAVVVDARDGVVRGVRPSPRMAACLQ